MSATPAPRIPRKTFKSYPDFYRKYFWSLVWGRLHRQLWKNVHAATLFIGYPRTGASMTGALLDAHPNMVFAQELHLLRAMELGFSRHQIFALILQNSRQFVQSGTAGQGHVVGSKYSYAVPNQWQGRHQELLVVGDKQAPGTTLHLTRRPELVSKLADRLGVRIRMIHMIRNPFDCISGIFRLKSGRGTHSEIRQSIDSYLYLLGGVLELKRRHGDDILDLRLEDLIAKPAESLSRVCVFLGVSCPKDYINDCSSILFDKPRSGSEMTWTESDIQRVNDKIATVSFLQGYSIPPGIEESRRSATA